MAEPQHYSQYLILTDDGEITHHYTPQDHIAKLQRQRRNYCLYRLVTRERFMDTRSREEADWNASSERRSPRKK